MNARTVLGGISVLAILVFLAMPLEAQENRLGLVGGVTIATWGGDDAGDPDSSLGFDVGAFYSLGTNDTWALRPGVYYVQKGIEESDVDGDAELSVDYVEFPLLLEYRVPTEGAMGVHLFGGPAVALEVGCEVEGSAGGATATADCDAIGLDTKSVDFGAMIGGGLQFAAGESFDIVVEANYNLGLVSIIDDTAGDADVKNRALQINAGVSLPVGG